MQGSSPHVSVVLSDRNWILERLGRELQVRLPKIDLNDAADPSADINYYITFACRKQPAPTLEMGFFAHMEQTPALQELFVRTAREVDVPVTMNTLYRDRLHAEGIKSAITIPPGVDLDRFDVKLRIGIVGRAYHTGRKGEALVAEVMDVPGIDWHFTGPGWPKPNRYIPEEELPDFYRSLDYVLVPALYEGGPMCVPEALAVGTPVIASDVGWVRDFPHIPFRTGDAADLRRVLTDLVAQKRELRASTEGYTWDAYAEAHARVFHDLMRKADKSPRAKAALKAPFTKPVRLLLHGGEHKSLGGPSIRVPRTAEALRNLGVPAQSSVFGRVSEIEEDIVHLFNVWSPESALGAMQKLKEAGKTVVFSPIYLDLSEREFWHFQLPNLPLDNPDQLAAAYSAARMHQQGRGRLSEAIPGYNAMVRRMLDMADHVVFLSSAEREALERIGARIEDSRASLIRNPVEASLWREGDPALFRKTYLDGLVGPGDYVICVGRIEERKNQLLLARAMRDMDLRLVLVGHAGNSSYAQRVQAEAGDRLLMVGRLEPAGEMLRSALAGARAFALPSWSEGASLAVLEAAAGGANMVLSDRSSEREYFGELAHYCDPGDPASIRQALEAAVGTGMSRKSAKALKDLVKREHSWERYAEDTGKAYAAAAEAPARTATILAPPQPRTAPNLVLDITTLAHHNGRITGISRVESILAEELPKLEGKLRFICWNDAIQQFVDVPPGFARLNQASLYRARFDKQCDTPPCILSPDSTIVVAGSAWMQNCGYVRGLEDLKTRSGCGLISIVYDLIPFKFPFWFDRSYAPVFRENFFRLAAITDRFVTDSRSCARDVAEALGDIRGVGQDITPFRLGDPILAPSPEGKLADDSVPQRFAERKFVLAVGAVHTRKNYEMLYRVWARFSDENRHRDLHLVIVGGTAWNGLALTEQIAQDTRVNGRIHILSGIEDETLSWLYGHCLFTVFPSHYEGWGLPVAESLVHGKLCLASSSSSVPEIAPDFVEHIDPEDFISWVNRISFFASSGAARESREEAIREGYVPVAWSDTARHLAEIAREPRVIRSLQPLHAGEVGVANTEAKPLTIAFGPGWYPAERWGRWARTREVSITLRVDSCLREGLDKLRVLLNLNAHMPDSRPRRLAVWSKDLNLFTAEDVSNGAFPSELVLTIPVSQVEDDGTLTLVLSFPTSPETTKEGLPDRQLGLGLASATILDPELSNPLQSLRHTQNWNEGRQALRMDLALDLHRRIIAPHLSFSPAWGAGKVECRFEILVPLLPGASAQRLTLKCRPIATSDVPVRAIFRWNGRVLAEQRWTDDLPASVTMELDRTDLNHAAPAVLTIETDSLMTPAELKLGPTVNVAGLGVFELALTPKEG